jgi:hypothetical protein
MSRIEKAHRILNDCAEKLRAVRLRSSKREQWPITMAIADVEMRRDDFASLILSRREEEEE